MVKNIAIDGPAGAGKSTIAKAAAKRLGYIYVDTGSLYRAVALEMLSRGISADDKEKIINAISEIPHEYFSLRFIDGEQHVFAGENDVTLKIRTPEISMASSKVSAIGEVRSFLLSLQKKIAAENNVIMDGRDIGTVVLPNADLKIFLTASAEVRAERRFRELAEKGHNVDFEQVLADIKERDYNDSHRDISPLKMAADAVLADTSELTLDESIELVVSLINEKIS